MGKGRGNSNSLTMIETCRLNIDAMIKSKVIRKGNVINYISSWTNGAKISVTTTYLTDEIEINLKYSHNDKPMDYMVYVSKVKSNLGFGYNHFFICPQTGNNCKTLICAYGSDVFKCRKAYNNRIYYSSQLASKVHKTSTRYFSLDKKINKLYDLRGTKLYNGIKTKRHLRMCKLIDNRHKLDIQREIELEQYLSKMFRHLM